MNRQDTKGIKRNWRSFMGLPRPHRRLLVLACVTLPLCAVLVRWLGFGRVLTLVDHLAGRHTGKLNVRKAREGPVNMDSARDVSLLVAAAANHGFHGTTCLHRSLVLHGLLLREGVPSDLRIGARKGEAGLEAHAWVEIGGTIIGEVEDPVRRFTPLERALRRP